MPKSSAAPKNRLASILAAGARKPSFPEETAKKSKKAAPRGLKAGKQVYPRPSRKDKRGVVVHLTIAEHSILQGLAKNQGETLNDLILGELRQRILKPIDPATSQDDDDEL